MNLPTLLPNVTLGTNTTVRAILSILLAFTLSACNSGNPHNNVLTDTDGDGVPDDNDVCPNGTRSNGTLGEGCADGCITGLTPDTNNATCVDIDECTLGMEDCHLLATCTNNFGGFSCDCPYGYTGDGHTCADVDECAAGQTACGALARCTNLDGKHTCTPCEAGFFASADGHTCLNVDECAMNQIGYTYCQLATGGECKDSEGSYECTKCPNDTKMGSDKKACLSPRFTLTTSDAAPNGAWSWFQDKRAIIDTSDPANPLLLLSSVSSANDGDPESGDVDILWRNLNTGLQGNYELHNRLEGDDHASAAIYQRTDGRYLAMYSKHGSDNLTRWRISTYPHDPLRWDAMQTLDNGAGTTYNNIYYLPHDNNGAGRLYNFTRSLNYDPTVQTSSNEGLSWSKGGKLLTQGNSSNRPYVKYASGGNKIHLVTTNDHPRNFSNSVYHGYVQDGVLYNSTGTVVDANLFDANGVSPTLLTPVFADGSQFNGTTMNRAWTISMEVDNTGNPAAILTARANDNPDDHRFFYARFDGAKWQIHEMAKAGGYLYTTEDDYTGLASIDPENPNVVYMSSIFDPRSQTPTNKYELYRGITSNSGASWSWSAITEDSTVDNLRPIVPSWNGQETVVLWMRGAYTSYTNWNTEAMGLRLTDAGNKALLWRGTSENNVWSEENNNWDSGKGSIDAYHQGDEVTFDDSADTNSDTLNVNLQGTLSPIGVAFNNNLKPYKLTGTGISGSGGLRVVGEGTVTLANSANSYTGETLVSQGKLILQATIGNSSSIYVANQGTLDVTGLASNTLTLSGRPITVDGTVVGNVTLNNSTFVGEGQINGNLVANTGTVVRVGDTGFNAVSSVENAVYIDASSGTTGNTTLSSSVVFDPKPDGTTGLDNNWEERKYASHGNAYESGGEVAEDAPQLKTTISDLTPDHSYQVYVMFWDAGASSGDGQRWNIRAGFASDSLNFYANGTNNDASTLGASSAALASTLTYSTPPTLFTENNRVMLAANIGLTTANASGQIEVFVDDMPPAGGANRRTWYDGIALLHMIRPQSSTLTVNGNYNQNANTKLQLDIHSPQALDRLAVSNTFTAAGTLAVSLVAGAPAPKLGDSFPIIQAKTFSGTFSSRELPTLDSGLAWELTNGALKVIAKP